MGLILVGNTRFPNGVTNVPESGIFNALRSNDQTLYHTYLNDFDTYVAGDWTVTETQAGATQALTNGDGGLIALVNSAANADVNQIQKVGESFLMEAGKPFYMRIRGKVDNATNGVFFAGVQVTNTDGSGAVTDGIYFLKPAASTSVSIYCRKNTTTGSNTAVVTTMADDTYIVLECYYDGVDRLYYGYNGTVVGYIDASSTYLPDTTLAPILGVKNGTAAARTGTFDLFFASKQRATYGVNGPVISG